MEPNGFIVNLGDKLRNYKITFLREENTLKLKSMYNLYRIVYKDEGSNPSRSTLSPIGAKWISHRSAKPGMSVRVRHRSLSNLIYYEV